MTKETKPSAKRKAPAQRAPVETPSDVAPAPIEDAANAAALVAAINAPVDDPGGHRAAAIAKAMTITPHEQLSLQFAVCPVCGSRQTVEICPVDGHRFEAP